MTDQLREKAPAPAAKFPLSDEEFALSEKQHLRRRWWAVGAIRLALLVVIFGSWELMSGTVIDEFNVSKPSAIAARLGEWLMDGTLIQHGASTLTAMALGFVVGLLCGVTTGFILGRVKVVADVLHPFIVALNSLPKLALAPLFVLWFGIGLTSKVLMTALVVFFLVFYNTFAGARNTDEELLGVVSIFGANRRQLLATVIIPSTATWILTGIRVAIPYSLIGAVIAEITASNEGLGYLLKSSANMFDTAGTFAAILVLVIVALVLSEVVNRLESVTDRWK